MKCTDRLVPEGIFVVFSVMAAPVLSVNRKAGTTRVGLPEAV